MKKIIPFNNIVLSELLEDPEKKAGSIFLPEDMGKRFIRLKVLAVGKLVEGMKPGEIVLANNLFEASDPANPKIGFINSRDILANPGVTTNAWPLAASAAALKLTVSAPVGTHAPRGRSTCALTGNERPKRDTDYPGSATT